MTTRFADDEIVVCAIQLGTVQTIFRRGGRYLGAEANGSGHPEFFLRESEATEAALYAVQQRHEDEAKARNDALDAAREKAEAAMRPKPRKVYAEHERVICIKQCGVESHGGRAASMMMLPGTVCDPDHPMVLAARKCFRSVLPKDATPEQCAVCTETHDGPEGKRTYAGEFVRRDDLRVTTNPTWFREPRSSAPLRGFTTWPMVGTYVVESDTGSRT